MSENKSETVHVLLAIQQESLSNGVKTVFSPYDDIQVVGELNNFENLIDSVKTLLPDILIISTSVRHSVIFELIKTVKISYSGVSVITIIENYDDELIYAALGSSASSCLKTGVEADELIACIHKVSHGEYPIFETLTRPGIARLIIKDMDSNRYGDNTDAEDTRKTLTDNEREILNMIGNGGTLEQLVSNTNSTEDDILLNLTYIYGKMVYNNFSEFQTRLLENPHDYDHMSSEDTAEDTTNTQTVDHNIPEQIQEEDKLHDIYDGFSSSTWEGFEALKKEFQESLERLTPAEDFPKNLPEEKFSEISGGSEEDSTAKSDTGDISSEAMMEINVDEFQPDGTIVFIDQKNDDLEIIDPEYESKSENLPEATPLIHEENTDNSENDTDNYGVTRIEETSILSRESYDTGRDLSVKVNDELKKPKTKWYRFSFKRGAKNNTRDNTHNDNNKKEDKSVPDQLDTSSTGVSGLENDNKKSINITNDDSKNIALKDSRTKQGEDLSSYKKLGMVIIIQPPFDVKQLERFESVVNDIDGINVVLHKGTAQEHYLIISAQDRSNLLNILRDNPLVENAIDENEVITLTLLPLKKVD